MKNFVLKASLLTVALSLTMGCKQDGSNEPTKSEWIDKIKITNNQVKFEYITTFSQNLEADIEGEFPINKYGSIIFFNDENGRLNVGISAALDLFKEGSLQEVRTLPNGANFPRIVTGPLYQMEIAKNEGSYRIFAMVDKNVLDATSTRLAGMALELDNLRNNFPAISITQSFFKGNKRYASFTLYGPRTINGKTLPGGLFLIGDVNALVNEATGVWVNQPTIHGPEASKYQSVDAKLALLKQTEKALAASGFKFKFKY